MPYSYEEVRKAPGGSEGQLPKVSIKQRNWEGGDLPGDSKGGVGLCVGGTRSKHCSIWLRD